MPQLKAITKFARKYRAEGNGQRVGQFFLNTYFKTRDMPDYFKPETGPDLFDETNHINAYLIIKRWLEENCYHTELPQECK